MLRRLLLPALFGFATCAAAQQLDRVWHRDLDSEVIDLVVRAPAKHDPSSTITWQQSVEKLGVRYVRLQLGDFQGDPESDAELRVLREPFGEFVASYRWKEMASSGDSFLTGLLPGGALRLQLVQGHVPRASSFKLMKLHSKTARKTLDVQSTAVPRDMPLSSFGPSHMVHQLARSVAMLHIGPTGVTCTGFLVAPDLLATNHHCMVMSLRFLQTETQSQKECDDVLIEFDYVKNERGPTARCVRVEKSDEPNDIALLRLRQIPKAADGTDRAPLTPGVLTGAWLTILHYPSGLPLAVEVMCNNRGTKDGDLMHDCGTSPGSSGSAIFNDASNVVGIHYKGAYPPHWTLEQVYADRPNGPRFNRAKPSTTLQP